MSQKRLLGLVGMGLLLEKLRNRSTERGNKQNKMSTMTKEVALAVVANDKGRKELARPVFADQVKRVARFHEVLNGLEVGHVSKFDTKSASALADIRIRDAVVRKLYDLYVAEDKETLANYRLTLEHWASKTSGDARLSILALWAGSHWFEGNQEPINAVLETENLGDYALWHLLDIAKRHNVPSEIWGESIKAVSLSECLRGAV